MEMEDAYQALIRPDDLDLKGLLGQWSQPEGVDDDILALFGQMSYP
jgi:hypothetical protein